MNHSPSCVHGHNSNTHTHTRTHTHYTLMCNWGAMLSSGWLVGNRQKQHIQQQCHDKTTRKYKALFHLCSLPCSLNCQTSGLSCAQVLEMTPPQKDYWANMQHKKITGIPSVHSDYKTLSTGGWEHREWNRSTELVSSFSCADLTLLQAHHPLSSLTSGTVWALVLLPSFMFCKQNIKITITICIILIIW